MKPIELNAINSPQQTKVQKPTSPRPNTSQSAPTISRGADQVSVSPRAEEINRLVAVARELPEIRQERVDLLKHLVDTGQYHVSSKVIADSILADEM